MKISQILNLNSKTTEFTFQGRKFYYDLFSDTLSTNWADGWRSVMGNQNSLVQGLAQLLSHKFKGLKKSEWTKVIELAKTEIESQ